MSHAYTDEERREVRVVLESLFTDFVMSRKITTLSAVVVSHLVKVHGYTRDDAVKEICALTAEAMRRSADGLEEACLKVLADLVKSTKSS